MSGQITVIGGAQGGTLTGIVTVPASGLTGNAAGLGIVQSAFDTIDQNVINGLTSLTNNNVVTGAVTTFSGSSSVGGVYEITNTDAKGNTTYGSANTQVTETAGYTAVVVQAPGQVSVSGNGGQNTYLLGSSTTSVVSTNGSGGGINTIAGLGGNSTIYGGGDNLVGFAGGNDRFKVLAGNDTVYAYGNATVRVGVPNGYGGNIDFVNQSSAVATVIGGRGAVTAFGGTAGGYLSGGSGGYNSLTGGSGAVTLVGAHTGDVLTAGVGTTSVNGRDYLFGGDGNETLTATSLTGTNLLVAGTGNDLMMSSGSGTQYFFSGSGNSTMTGSTVAGSVNQYFFGGTLTGGNDVITNYVANSDRMSIVGGATITSILGAGANGKSTKVFLSDNTVITLQGTNISTFDVNKSVGTALLLPTTPYTS